MSLPMLSGSCWTKRITESNRTAPEILRGFFAPYPPADASCRKTVPRRPIRRPSRNTGAGLHRPAVQPAIFPVTNSPIPARLCSPLQALLPPLRQNPARPALPYHAGTDTHDPAAQPAIFPVTSFPFLHALLSNPAPAPKRSPAPPLFPATQAQTRTAQPPSPLSSPFTSSPIPAQLSSPADPYKNPGSRPPPGFLVISGSVRFPLQQRLR